MAKKTAQKQEQMTEDEKQMRRRIGNATKADLAKWFMQIWNENNELNQQMNKKLEESKEYQNMVKQLNGEAQLKQIAVSQRKKAEETAQNLEAKCKELRQQLEDLQTAKSLPDAQETAQNTAENVPDVQATDKPEEAQNGTQGSTEVIEEPLSENEKERLYKTNKQLQWLNLQLMRLLEDIGVPQDTVERLLNESENLSDGMPKRIQEFSEKWKKDMISKLEEAYETDNRPLSDEVAANIIATWCSTPRAEQALKLLYIHFMSPLDEYDEEEYKQFTKRQEEQAKIEEQEQTIAGLQAELENIKTTAQYNSTAGNYKLVDEQAKKIKGLKKDLDKLQEKYQQATRHNARGAGRKPKLTDDQVQEIQKLRADGMVMTEISKKIGCSVGLVYNILSKNK